MTTARQLLTGDTLQAVVSIIGIAALVVTGLVVLAISPTAKDSVIPLVSIGVTALVRRPPAAVAVAPATA